MARQKKTKEPIEDTPIDRVGDLNEARNRALGTDLGVLEMTHGFQPVPRVSEMNEVAIEEQHCAGLGFWHADGKEIPDYATAFSAGFDLRANLEVGRQVDYYDHSNVKRSKSVKGDSESTPRLFIEPGERVLVPTGLHADIPRFAYLALHSRSGTSWKQGLILTNGVGVVDSDYVEEIKVSLTNISGVRVVIEDGERIAQALLMPAISSNVIRLDKKPQQKTDRAGGFGSTGTK